MSGEEGAASARNVAGKVNETLEVARNRSNRFLATVVYLFYLGQRSIEQETGIVISS